MNLDPSDPVGGTNPPPDRLRATFADLSERARGGDDEAIDELYERAQELADSRD